jgi:hypothetical protein
MILHLALNSFAEVTTAVKTIQNLLVVKSWLDNEYEMHIFIAKYFILIQVLLSFGKKNYSVYVGLCSAMLTHANKIRQQL